MLPVWNKLEFHAYVPVAGKSIATHVKVLWTLHFTTRRFGDRERNYLLFNLTAQANSIYLPAGGARASVELDRSAVVWPANTVFCYE